MTREKEYGHLPWANTIDEAVEFKKNGQKYKVQRDLFFELREDGYWYGKEEAKEKLREDWLINWRLNDATGRYERIEG